jgi:hypothetical protein
MSNNHGGRRPGAGRKPSGRKSIPFWITDEENQELRKYLEEMRRNGEMKKYQISELTIVPVKKHHDRQVELENGIWLKNLLDGRGYDEQDSEWAEIPGRGWANVPMSAVDWSEIAEVDD